MQAQTDSQQQTFDWEIIGPKISEQSEYRCIRCHKYQTQQYCRHLYFNNPEAGITFDITKPAKEVVVVELLPCICHIILRTRNPENL